MEETQIKESAVVEAILSQHVLGSGTYFAPVYVAMATDCNNVMISPNYDKSWNYEKADQF